MTAETGEQLYGLLPALYRTQDVGEGEPLKAFLSVLESVLQELEGNIDELYDNWFIETCAEWAVPYIADLLDVCTLLPASKRGFSQRAFVANTLAYRRAKGTAAVLEQLARDVTGWPAKTIEFFELLATTQYMNHVRPDKGGTVSVRDADALELIQGPFERAAHTVDVRHVDNARGKYNIPNVGLYLWRLQSYAVSRGSPRAAADRPDGRYTFSPLGYDAQLFNQPRTETELSHLTGEANVPGPLRRRPLSDAMQRSQYLDEQPVLQVRAQVESETHLRPYEIVICDLSDPPAASSDWRRPAAVPPHRVAVDPVLGRLAFPKDATPAKVEVSYSYGFSGDIGGGPYDRQSSSRQWLDPARVTWQRGVTQDSEALAAASDPALLTTSLMSAIKDWKTYVDSKKDAAPFGLIAIMDSATYDLRSNSPQIEVPAGGTLAIVAADWPETERTSVKEHLLGHISPDGVRPHIIGDLTVLGTAAGNSINPDRLVLDGLLVEGKLIVAAGNLGSLRMAHCTLVPDKGGLLVETGSALGTQNPSLLIHMVRCISGKIQVSAPVAKLSIEESIVDDVAGAAIDAPDAATEVQASTVFGATRGRSLDASNTIFTGRVTAHRRQVGCVRFSYLPLGSLAARRYRCQPAGAPNVAPQFTSRTYGEPHYAQLAADCPVEILTGADDQGEIGAFNVLQQTQRLKNLRATLNEYLRFGLEVGTFFAT